MLLAVFVTSLLLALSSVQGQFTGQTRLVNNFGSTTTSGGRVEIYYNGQWGTVCDDGFGATEASVVCRERGYLSYSRYGSVGSLRYSQGSSFTPIWLDDVDCSSFDSALRFCSNRGIGVHNCGHSEDIAVECTNTNFITNTVNNNIVGIAVGVSVAAFVLFVVAPIIICIVVAVCVCGCAGAAASSSNRRTRQAQVVTTVPPTAAVATTSYTTSSTTQQAAYPMDSKPATVPPPYSSDQPAGGYPPQPDQVGYAYPPQPDQAGYAYPPQPDEKAAYPPQ